MPIAKINPQHAPDQAPQHALVIGGGIVGLSCAIALQRQGIATTLATRSRMRGTASWGNAGHIATEQVEPLASLATVRSMPGRLFCRGGALALPPRLIGAWLPFSLRLLRATAPATFARGKTALEAALALAMPAWRRLLDTAAAPDLLVEAGHFIVWETPASAARGRRHWSRAALGATTSWRDATAGEIAAIQAHVACPVAGAIRFAGSGQIADPDALADALETAFAALGGRYIDAGAQALRRRPDGTVAVDLDNGETHSADAVIVAAGAASAALLAPLGLRAPMIAERGYHIQADGSGWPADMPPVVFEDRSMIVTRFRSGLRAASFVEFGTLDAPADPRKWDRLEQHAKALGLPMHDPAPWMGARPTLPDYLPAIGKSPAANNLYYAFGHQHLGLTLGPLTGEAIAAIVARQPTPIDIAPFSLQRFGNP
ncbi:FAD-binding oxidoreductase [Sphingobium aquiterrae]|uniref:NAD(P)/FAD-dependent oxidoreductase n=1 Tax=Sphingobium aquiterrae TaxID=2038656 RepID=UPI003018A195